MTIRIQCPQGHRLAIKDEMAGKTGTCPQCQEQVQIPSAAAVPCTKLTEQAILDMLGVPAQEALAASTSFTESSLRLELAAPAANARHMNRGKKTCPKCKMAIAASLDICPCCNMYFVSKRELARRMGQ